MAPLVSTEIQIGALIDLKLSALESPCAIDVAGLLAVISLLRPRIVGSGRCVGELCPLYLHSLIAVLGFLASAVVRQFGVGCSTVSLTLWPGSWTTCT